MQSLTTKSYINEPFQEKNKITNVHEHIQHTFFYVTCDKHLQREPKWQISTTQ